MKYPGTSRLLYRNDIRSFSSFPSFGFLRGGLTQVRESLWRDLQGVLWKRMYNNGFSIRVPEPIDVPSSLFVLIETKTHLYTSRFLSVRHGLLFLFFSTTSSVIGRHRVVGRLLNLELFQILRKVGNLTHSSIVLIRSSLDESCMRTRPSVLTGIYIGVVDTLTKGRNL